MPLTLETGLVACVASALFAGFELSRRRVPTWLGLGLIAVALVVRLLVPLVGGGVPLGFLLMDGVVGMIMCSIVPVLLWRLKALAASDARLFAGLGALLGIRPGLDVELLAFVGTLVVAPVILAYRGQLGAALSSLLFLLVNPLLPRARRREPAPGLLTELPLSPATFLATTLVLIVPWLSHAR